MTPLWRIVVGESGATYYGPEDGRYGTEAAVRREYEAYQKLGCSVRLEHRDSPEESWREQSGRAENYPLFD